VTNQYQKFVKPLIDSPFIPQEVESLVEKSKLRKDFPMTSVTLIGPNEKSTGINEVNFI